VTLSPIPTKARGLIDPVSAALIVDTVSAVVKEVDRRLADQIAARAGAAEGCDFLRRVRSNLLRELESFDQRAIDLGAPRT
jgi:hypothetical protein